MCSPVGLSHAGESSPSHTTAEEKGDRQATTVESHGGEGRDSTSYQTNHRELAHYWKRLHKNCHSDLLGNITPAILHRKDHTGAITQKGKQFPSLGVTRCRNAAQKEPRKGVKESKYKAVEDAVLSPARHTGPYPRTLRGADLALRWT